EIDDEEDDQGDQKEHRDRLQEPAEDVVSHASRGGEAARRRGGKDERRRGADVINSHEAILVLLAALPPCRLAACVLPVEPDGAEVLEEERVGVEAFYVGAGDVVENEVSRDDAGADLVPTLLELEVGLLALLLVELAAAGGDEL